MKKVTLIARLLLGFVFTGAGVAFFLTTPPPLEGAMADFFKGTEITCGLLLLSGFFVPLALVVLAPIILNIFLVNAFMMPEGLVLATILGVLEVYLSFFSTEYSPKIKQLFHMR
jgi:putative oxidoreductase